MHDCVGDQDAAEVVRHEGFHTRSWRPGFIKDAAREAIRAADIDLLCILGFAFDPQATGVTQDDGVTDEAGDVGFANVTGERKMGRIKVLLVRMNADLLMGEDLKKAGAGNLLTVFWEAGHRATRHRRRSSHRRSAGCRCVRPDHG